MDCTRVSFNRRLPATLLILPLVFIASVTAADDVIRLCRGEMYSPVSDDLRLDFSVVDCAVSRLELPYQATEKPWLRCIHETRSESFDGVYPLAQMDFMIGGVTGNMVASDPVSIEKWYWLTLKNPADLKSLRFGAIRGSNQHVWLMSQGLSVSVEANSVEQLFMMLEGGRVDVILGTERDLPFAETRGISHYFVRYLPLHAYFKPEFLEQMPDFLAHFNDQLTTCQPDNWVKLSAEDQRKLEELALGILAEVSPLLLQSHVFEAHPVELSRAEIIASDKVWRGDPSGRKSALQAKVLENSLSQELKAIKQASHGLIEELFLMDSQGLLVSSSDLTSDYWQGNEDKYLQVTGPQAARFFIDQVRYDQSSRIFQSQVSLPLNSPEGELRGVLMIGVNVEKALSEAPL